MRTLRAERRSAASARVLARGSLRRGDMTAALALTALLCLAAPGPDAASAPSRAPPASHARTSTAPLDANVASAAELATLPGIGPVIAERIVAARAQRGFTSTSDLARRVRGVGPRTLERIGPRLVVHRPAGLVPPKVGPRERPPPRPTDPDPRRTPRPDPVSRSDVSRSAHPG